MFGFAKKLVKQAEGIIAPEDSDSPEFGFRVLYVEPESPAYEHGLEPLFDYILAVNGQRFDHLAKENGFVHAEHTPAVEFSTAVQQAATVNMEVWSSKGRSVRVVSIPQTGKLGLSTQYTPLQTSMNVWHILNIDPLSSAFEANLQPHADYIVAAENGLLEEGGEGLLGRVIANTDPSVGIVLYVYNSDFNVLRPVRVYPKEGRLGCGVGYGLLHQLPMVTSNLPTHPPGTTLFDDQQGLVPNFEPFTPSAPPTHNRRRRAGGYNKTANLDVYFNEQTEISHQIDGSNIEGKANAPPPKPT